jgi:hypothetical protein
VKVGRSTDEKEACKVRVGCRENTRYAPSPRCLPKVLPRGLRPQNCETDGSISRYIQYCGVEFCHGEEKLNYLLYPEIFPHGVSQIKTHPSLHNTLQAAAWACGRGC